MIDWPLSVFCWQTILVIWISNSHFISKKMGLFALSLSVFSENLPTKTHAYTLQGWKCLNANARWGNFWFVRQHDWQTTRHTSLSWLVWMLVIQDLIWRHQNVIRSPMNIINSVLTPSLMVCLTLTNKWMLCFCESSHFLSFFTWSFFISLYLFTLLGRLMQYYGDLQPWPWLKQWWLWASDPKLVKFKSK